MDIQFYNKDSITLQDLRTFVDGLGDIDPSGEGYIGNGVHVEADCNSTEVCIIKDGKVNQY